MSWIEGEVSQAEAQRRRIKTYRLARNNALAQRAAIAESRRNPEFWMDNFVWTYDPRRKPSLMPFILFPYQRDYLRWRIARWEGKEHGLVEKSRDAGASWINIAHHVWCWLFVPEFAGLLASRKAMLVDRIGDPSSLFEKARMVIRHMPKWMLPKGFAPDKHDNYCKIINPVTGATITGEAGNNIGRGGRVTFADIDEAAFLERPQSVESAVSQTTHTVFWTSTPNGAGNLFARKRMGGLLPVFTMHWKDDPRKNHWEALDGSVGNGRNAPAGAVFPWYEKQRLTLEPVTIAQEIDIDYNASVEGVFIRAEHVQAAVELEIEECRGDIWVAGLDVAHQGKNRNVLVVRHGPTVKGILDWSEPNLANTVYRAREEVITHFPEVETLIIDADGPGSGAFGLFNLIEDLPFRVQAFHGGGACTDYWWHDLQRSSKERFRNARAEAAGRIRQKIMAAYAHRTGDRENPIHRDDLISIPNHPTLIAQASQIKAKFTDTGKIQIESKKDMSESPDFFDALCYSFWPVERSGIGTSLGSLWVE